MMLLCLWCVLRLLPCFLPTTSDLYRRRQAQRHLSMWPLSFYLHPQLVVGPADGYEWMDERMDGSYGLDNYCNERIVGDESYLLKQLLGDNQSVHGQNLRNPDHIMHL